MTITNHGTFEIYTPTIAARPAQPVAPTPPVMPAPLASEPTPEQQAAHNAAQAAYQADMATHETAKTQHAAAMETWRAAVAVIDHWQALVDVGAIFARRSDGGDWYEITQALPDDRHYCTVIGGKVISVAPDSQMFGIQDGTTLLESTVHPEIGWTWDGASFAPPARDLAAEINRERDRRIGAGFTFGGKRYDTDIESRANIAGAMTLALAAISVGKQPGDLRWSDPDKDFGWIAVDNTVTLMDAQTCLAFAMAAADYKSDCIFAARTLKDMMPIPEDYANDQYWPASSA